MADPAVAYAFYSGEYGGQLDEGGFATALPHALAAVRRRIWPNGPDRDEAAWARAVCAACDVDAAHGFAGGDGPLASVTTGTVSMSFGASGGSSPYEADMRAAIDGELVGSGLLYMGIG